MRKLFPQFFIIITLTLTSILTSIFSILKFSFFLSVTKILILLDFENLDKKVGLKFVPRICTGLSKTDRLKLILYQQDIFNRKERNSKQMTTDFGFRVKKLHNLIC